MFKTCCTYLSHTSCTLIYHFVHTSHTLLKSISHFAHTSKTLLPNPSHRYVDCSKESNENTEWVTCIVITTVWWTGWAGCKRWGGEKDWNGAGGERLRLCSGEKILKYWVILELYSGEKNWNSAVVEKFVWIPERGQDRIGFTGSFCWYC